ncbi:type 2 lantipeptide synthetase LanM [Thalassospira sp. HF15]|uniref:type 2 lanthipeptide synthetase LanM n=1 Tax=Thalassospira sp. HF15 TaxID=2722755 RepID=UPI00142F6694|nr:type 2 lanthipeptide synthetase LanM [Thalassospira sp. HF15]NIY75288.1 type 2 lantipeptide synthetase LanM [Thalassospira sp. HF15]
MNIDPFWASIAAKAATLDERLSGRYVPKHVNSGDPETQNEIDQANLQRWCDFASIGDHDLFARRLARDGLHANDSAPLLGEVALRDGEAPPEWLETAQWIFDAIIAGDNASDSCPDEIATKVAFGDFLWPVIGVARKQVTGFSSRNLNARAKADLDAILLRRMARICERTLFESFESFRQAVGIKPEDASGRELYDAFKSALRGGPFANLISNRPVMIRLMATIVDQWIVATREFIERLDCDHARFADHFAVFENQSGPGRVAKIIGGISDAHDHGRSVLVLEFENGAKIVYKPRPIRAEEAWKSLSDWLINTGSDIRLSAAKTWCQPDYGWMEYISHKPELSGHDANTFYRASGQLLAVMYWLKGSDMHHENFLVADGRPVVIDLETLFQPELRFLPGNDPALHAKQLATQRHDAGISAVGLLPQRKNIGGHWVDDGGLAHAAPKTVKIEKLIHINHGNMVFETITEERPLSGIELLIDGAPANPAEYVSDLLAGYRDAIEFLQDHRDAVLGPDGPIAKFRNVRIRHVLRPTAYYQELEQAVCIPQNQQDGVTWSLTFERLARRARWDLDDYPGWAILAHERRALARLDVPLFTGKTDQNGVWSEGELVSTDLTASAVLPKVADRLDQLKRNIDYDSAIIRQMICLGEVNFPPARCPWPTQTNHVEGDVTERAKTIALSIATEIADQAIVCEDSACWVTVDASPDGEALQITAMNEMLYGGTAGLALFFASCYGVDRFDRWRDMAFKALAAPRATARQSNGIGGFEGIGGLIYVLCRCADLLDAPELLDEALDVSSTINDTAVNADKALDVISGVAGTILALVGLYHRTQDPDVLERAILCGRHLPDNPADWNGISDHTLAGMSHGAAGLVYALLKLYQASGKDEFLSLAKRGLDYERGLFDPEAHGWPDLRDDTPKPDPIQWCHGAAGIGLARMAGLEVLDDQHVREEIETAIAAVLAVPDGGRDNLCCGHAGRFSMLQYADGLGLGPSDLKAVLNHRLHAWMDRLNDPAAIGLMARDRVFQNNLMQGLPGIGQALLEVAAPDQIRPVLLLR